MGSSASFNMLLAIRSAGSNVAFMSGDSRSRRVLSTAIEKSFDADLDIYDVGIPIYGGRIDCRSSWRHHRCEPAAGFLTSSPILE